MDKNDPRYVEARRRLQHMVDAAAKGSQEEADRAYRDFKDYASEHNRLSSQNNDNGAPMAVQTFGDKGYQPPPSSLSGYGHNKSHHPSVKDPHNGVAYLGMALAVLAGIAAMLPFDVMHKATTALLAGAALFSIGSFFARRVQKSAAFAAVVLTLVCAGWVGLMRLEIFQVFSVDQANGIVEEWRAANGDDNSDDQDGSGPTDVVSPQPRSSREDPLPVGTEVASDHWKVTVNSIEANATQQILADDEYADPPKSGYQYMVANVSITYLGGDPDRLKDTPSQIEFEYVTEGGNTIRKGEDAFSVILDDPLSTNDLYPDATASGSLVFCIPKNDNGVLSVDLGTYGEVINYYEVQ